MSDETNPNGHARQLYDDREAWREDYDEEPEIRTCPFCGRFIYEEDYDATRIPCFHRYRLHYLNWRRDWYDELLDIIPAVRIITSKK